MIKAVFFDLDGTLYDYDLCESYARDVLIRTVAGRTNRRTDDVIKAYDEGRCMIKEGLGLVAASHNRMLYIQKTHELLGLGDATHMLEDYNTYWEAFLSKMRTYSYVIHIFEKLRQSDIYIGLITDLTAHIQFRKLVRLGLYNMFDAITTSEEAGVEKPDKRIYDLALKKAQVDAGEVLMIGDDIYRDVKGAETVGMQAVLFDKDSFDEESFLLSIGLK